MGQVITHSLDLGLLGFLRTGPKHGYAIHQELSDPAGLGQVWQIKLSQLYAMLGKLEEAGFISASTVTQENKPPRKLFHLREEGRSAFLSWVESPVNDGRSLRLEFLIKLYFASLEGTDVAARLLVFQRERCQDWLAKELDLVREEKDHHRKYSGLVHQFRSGQIQAMLAWLDSCEEE
jgi:DNA-binding PadR family transcriptional regulator